jgi:predicted acyl esterase
MTANVFLPGHRIRLEVSSNNLGRNSNSGGEIVSEVPSEYRAAINRACHDTVRPS